MNLGTIADAASAGAPERSALQTSGGPVSYGRLTSIVASVARRLGELGVGRGHRVGVVDLATVASVATALAAARVGGSAVLMNPALTSRESADLLQLVGCRLLVAADGAAAVAAAGETRVVTTAEILAAPAAPDVGGPVGADGNEALVLFTSGTTGLPKAVPIANGVLCERIAAFAAPFDVNAEPNVSLLCVPFFHVGGSLACFGALYSGNTVVLQERFDAGQWLELVSRHRVRSAFLVPTMLQRILDHPAFASTDLSSLASISYGAAAAPVELVRRAMAALPRTGFANVFGQTETLGAYTTLLPADHRDPRRIGSVGRPAAGVEVRVVMPGTDDPVEAASPGELMVRCPHSVQPGWLRTGDLARQDEDGYLYPVGRISDTINRGGEKFGPLEVENVLRAHPAVVDVAVAGLPDTEMGERVGAAVVASQPVTPDDLRAFCRQHLARFKLPERIVFVEHIPYSATGKVTRREVAKLVSDARAQPQGGSGALRP